MNEREKKKKLTNCVVFTSLIVYEAMLSFLLNFSRILIFCINKQKEKQQLNKIKESINEIEMTSTSQKNI